MSRSVLFCSKESRQPPKPPSSLVQPEFILVCPYLLGRQSCAQPSGASSPQVPDGSVVALVSKQVTAYNAVNNSTVSRTSASKYGESLTPSSGERMP